MKFDKYEWRIMQALQENGRLTNQELSERVGLSSTPCWRRLNDLNQSGVIQRCVAILDPQLVGIRETAFAHVTIDQRNESRLSEFESAVKKCPEVLECYASMGDADYLLKVAVPDVSSYDHFLKDFVFKLPGVVQVRSNLALRTIKRDTALPLEVFNKACPELHH